MQDSEGYSYLKRLPCSSLENSNQETNSSLTLVALAAHKYSTSVSQPKKVVH